MSGLISGLTRILGLQDPLEDLDNQAQKWLEESGVHGGIYHYPVDQIPYEILDKPARKRRRSVRDYFTTNKKRKTSLYIPFATETPPPTTGPPTEPPTKPPRTKPPPTRPSRPSLPEPQYPTVPPPMGKFSSYRSTARMGRKFKRGRKTRVSKLAAYGAMIKTETGGEVTHPECVYVGHATCAPEKVLRVAVMALLRKLFALKGIYIKAFTDSPRERQGPPATARIGAFQYYWKDGEVGAITEQVVTLNATDNYDNMVDNIIIDFKTRFAPVNLPVIEAFELRLDTQEATSVTMLPARLLTNNMRVSLFMTSEMSIQNRTVAATAGTGDEHRDANDVQNNPLEGYCYYTKSNTFRVAQRDQYATSTTYAEFGPDLTYGDITLTPASAGLNAQDQENLKRPVTHSYFRSCTRSRRHSIQPGQIRKSKLKNSVTMKFNMLLRKLEHWFHNSTTEGLTVFIGSARMFGFEKLMHTRATNEPDMIVGYEVNNFYGATIRCGKIGIVVEKDIA
jgi:hypothetical protein